MQCFYSFEQYCPKCNKNVIIEEKYTDAGETELYCRESGECVSACETVTRITAILSDRKKF